MKFGFESGGDHNPFLDNAYKKALEVLAIDAINLEEFSHLYGEENIALDKKRIEEVKEKFDHESEEMEKLAKVFEAIIHEQIELSDWLGENAHTVRPSEYDDIVNGVDEIVEFAEEGKASHLALSIDVTFSSLGIKKKLERVKKDIDRGELTRLKYFRSEDMGFMGELRNIPRVVVGAKKEAVLDLVSLWLRGEKAELAKHPIRAQILEEITLQLQAFERYAAEKGKEDLAFIMKRTGSIIRAIRSGTPPNDFVADNIESTLRSTFGRAA